MIRIAPLSSPNGDGQTDSRSPAGRGGEQLPERGRANRNSGGGYDSGAPAGDATMEHFAGAWI